MVDRKGWVDSLRYMFKDFFEAPNSCLQKEFQPDGEQMGTCLWVGNPQSLGSRVEEC